MRGIAYNRDISNRKARRKKRLSDSWLWGKASPWYNNLHQYSKNKIHCSCGMCSCKTNQHHERSAGVGLFYIYHYTDENGAEQKRLATNTWGTSHSGYRRNWSYRDLKRIKSMEEREKEYKNEIGNVI